MSRFNDRIDIQTCRDQHVALGYLLDQFNNLGPADESKIVGLLQRLRSVLVHHLRLEEEHLYPRLRQSEDPHIKALAERYQAQMGHLADAFSVLYARWTRAGAISTDATEYMKHWKTFETALRERMSAEDDNLYSMSDT